MEGASMKRIVLGVAVLVAAVSTASAFGLGGLNPGVYQTKIAGAKPAVLNGTWRLSLNKPGFAITKNLATAVAGTVTIVGNKITFTDIAGPLRCTGSQVKGTYTWTLKGTTLALKPVSETCAGRKLVLTHVYTKLA
jgi:hypothetical protein